MRRLVVALASAVFLVIAAIAPVAAASPPPYTVIASGLHSPRGLTFGAGNLYVAEAGLGSGSPSTGIGQGVGLTGSVTEVFGATSAHPRQVRIFNGLLSAADAEGVVGLDGISFADNRLYGVMALSDAGVHQTTGALGHTVAFTRSTGTWQFLADVGGFNYAWAGQHVSLAPNDFPDANPYGIYSLGDDGQYVVDAGTNTLDWIDENGHIRVLAYFPNNAIADATPTCITKGPDGAFYVGTLALADSAVNGPSAKVYRVDVRHATGSMSSILNVATVWASGLWPINGCAFGPNGAFYASEMFTSVTMGPNGPEPAGGDVVKIPWGHPSQHISLTGGTLPWAAGVAVARNGAVFAVGGTVFPNGFVARLDNR